MEIKNLRKMKEMFLRRILITLSIMTNRGDTFGVKRVLTGSFTMMKIDRCGKRV